MELEGSASILRKAFYLKHLPTGAGGLAYDFSRFVRLPQSGASGQQSPLLLKLFDNVLWREVEIDLGRLERVMPQQAL